MLKYVEVNTYINSITECAQKIVDRLESNLPLTALKNQWKHTILQVVGVIKRRTILFIRGLIGRKCKNAPRLATELVYVLIVN